MKTVLRAIVILAMFLGGWAEARSSGSPVCEITTQDMTTFMGATSLTSPGGWTLSAAGASYTPGQPLTLALSNTNAQATFKGLLLWAKGASGTFVGSFMMPSGFSSMAGCSMATLTHTSSASKNQQGFTWTAPGAGAGAVTFRAFVVVSSRNAWVELAPVTLTEGSTGTGGGASGTGGGAAGGSAGGASGTGGGAAGGTAGGFSSTGGGAAGGSSSTGGGTAGGSSSSGGGAAGGSSSTGGGAAGGSSSTGGGTAGGSSSTGGGTAGGSSNTGGGTAGGSSSAGGGAAGGRAGGSAGGGQAMDPGGCGCAAVDPLWGALGVLVLLARRRVTRG
jgi:hypothetical protein